MLIQQEKLSWLAEIYTNVKSHRNREERGQGVVALTSSSYFRL
jgi:hypothetical protein